MVSSKYYINYFFRILLFAILISNPFILLKGDQDENIPSVVRINKQVCSFVVLATTSNELTDTSLKKSKISLWGIITIVGGVIWIIAVNVSSNRVDKKLEDFFLYIVGKFLAFPKVRAMLFCHNGFALQLKNITNSQEESLEEKTRNTYISIFSESYKNAREKLWSGNNLLNSGIFIISGKLFTGRQFFLERELVESDHKADVFEVNETNWLDRNTTEGKPKLEVLHKRLWALCQRFELADEKHSQKVVILLGESITSSQLIDVVEDLKEILERNKGWFKSIYHKKLTLILKTNIQYISIKKISNGKEINVTKIDFESIDQDTALSMLNNNKWDEKLRKEVIASLKSCPFYQVELSLSR